MPPVASRLWLIGAADLQIHRPLCTLLLKGKCQHGFRNSNNKLKKPKISHSILKSQCTTTCTLLYKNATMYINNNARTHKTAVNYQQHNSLLYNTRYCQHNANESFLNLKTVTDVIS